MVESAAKAKDLKVVFQNSNIQQGTTRYSRFRRYAREEPVNPDLLRDRAKAHIAKSEWIKAMKCLNQTLTEPPNHPIGEKFVPNKHVS